MCHHHIHCWLSTRVVATGVFREEAVANPIRSGWSGRMSSESNCRPLKGVESFHMSIDADEVCGARIMESLGAGAGQRHVLRRGVDGRSHELVGAVPPASDSKQPVVPVRRHSAASQRCPALEIVLGRQEVVAASGFSPWHASFSCDEGRVVVVAGIGIAIPVRGPLVSRALERLVGLIRVGPEKSRSNRAIGPLPVVPCSDISAVGIVIQPMKECRGNSASCSMA